MASRIRNRSILYGGEICGTGSFGSPKFTPAYKGDQLCIDETHPGPPYRSGGPLLVKKKKVFIKRFDHLSVFYHSTLGWYEGYMGVTPYIPSPEPTPLSLSGWGAKGMSRTFPLAPVYNLGVSIGELKDFPGMVSQTLRGLRAIRNVGGGLKAFSSVGDFLKRGRRLVQNAGDSYLYGAFGLYPMLQDLLFLLQMREKLDKKIAWLRRKNGKGVRRKIELDSGGFSENIVRNVAPVATVFPSQSSNIIGPGMGVSQPFPILKTYQRRIWFAAKYRFYIPELATDPRKRPPKGGLSSDLLGLSLDPALIYKLTPWSWLLDWFTSVGAALSHAYLRAKYHVVAEYAYVMCKETFTYQAPGYIVMHSGKLSPSFQWVDPDRTFSGVSKTTYDFRQREVANPYGFGVTFASLSAYQWSILAALGLSRGAKGGAIRA